MRNQDSWADKITRNIHKQKYEIKKIKEKYYKDNYSKTKTYSFPSKINLDKYFTFRKNDVWKLSKNKNMLAIYPILCLRADFKVDKWFQIPQQEISVKTGLSIPSVKIGLDNLYKNKFINRLKNDEGIRRFYEYNVKFIRRKDIKDNKNKYFIFNQSIIDSGVWAKLKPRAKALYLSIRANASFYPDAFFGDQEIIDGDSYIDYKKVVKENFRKRKCDITNKPLSHLCRHVRIDNSNLIPIIKQLEEYRLIERYGKIFEVYLHPKINQINNDYWYEL